MRSFDLIIVGTGSGNSIIGPEHDDWDIALVERGVFGGTCLNVGCIPSKMFVHAAEVAELAATVGPSLGVHTVMNGVDWPQIRDRVFGRIDPIAAGGEDYRKSLDHVTVFQNDARFIGPKMLRVGDETITAEHIVIAAGARPFVPEVPGLAEAGFHTSDSIMRLDELPGRLAVLGGGYIATELGNVFGQFGSEITFVLRSNRFLRGEDHEISDRFTKIYSGKFPTLMNTTLVSARRDGDDLVLELESRGEISELRVDDVLVATGRVPNGDQLNVEESGVQLDSSGYVVADANLRTGVDGVWALGDVTNPVQLKHAANHEARVVAHNLVNPDEMIEADHRFVPHAVFGHPQVASVGLTEQQCIDQGRRYISHTQAYGSAAYGWAMEDTESFAKLIADPDSRQLIGAHIIGPQASTLIQQLIQGMTFGQTVDQMAREQYYIHPGLPEVIEQALLEL